MFVKFTTPLLPLASSPLSTMPKTKSASQLKQGRISFTNQKRTGSASKATPKGKSPATIKRASKKEHIDSDSSESLSDEVEIIESDDDARKSTRTGRRAYMRSQSYSSNSSSAISYEDIESDDSVEAPPPPPKKGALCLQYETHIFTLFVGKAKSKGKSRKAAADEDQIVETEFPSLYLLLQSYHNQRFMQFTPKARPPNTRFSANST